MGYVIQVFRRIYDPVCDLSMSCSFMPMVVTAGVPSLIPRKSRIIAGNGVFVYDDASQLQLFGKNGAIFNRVTAIFEVDQDQVIFRSVADEFESAVLQVIPNILAFLATCAT